MQAFKAANPGSVLEDFVKWHSPRDWESIAQIDPEELAELPLTEEQREAGGRLSRRMCDTGANFWHVSWNSAEPVPASQQKKMFDPQLEMEKAFHTLENISARQILFQLMVVAFNGIYHELALSPARDIAAVKAALVVLKEELEGLCARMEQADLDGDELLVDVDKIADLLSDTELKVSRATSLLAKLPGQHRMVGELIQWGVVDLTFEEKAFVSSVFELRLHQPEAREFTFLAPVQTLDSEGGKSGPTTPTKLARGALSEDEMFHRMYAYVRTDTRATFRMATALCYQD
jgi:hypothetical protein